MNPSMLEYRHAERSLHRCRLLLFDIPKNLQHLIDDKGLVYPSSVPEMIAQQLKRTTSTGEWSPPPFWQVSDAAYGDGRRAMDSFQFGSNRDPGRLGRMHAIVQRMSLTMGLLMGGTPIIRYGDELGIEQVRHARAPRKFQQRCSAD